MITNAYSSKKGLTMAQYVPFKERVKQDISKNRKRIKELGPGIITGSAGDDPAGIVTYTRHILNVVSNSNK